MLVDIETLLVVHDRGLDITAVVVGLRDTRIESGHQRKVVELSGECERLLVHDERLLRLPLVAERDCKINKPSVVERDVLDGAVLARLDALAKKTDLFFVRVRSLVCGRQN